MWTCETKMGKADADTVSCYISISDGRGEESEAGSALTDKTNQGLRLRGRKKLPFPLSPLRQDTGWKRNKFIVSNHVYLDVYFQGSGVILFAHSLFNCSSVWGMSVTGPQPGTTWSCQLIKRINLWLQKSYRLLMSFDGTNCPTGGLQQQQQQQCRRVTVCYSCPSYHSFCLFIVSCLLVLSLLCSQTDWRPSAGSLLSSFITINKLTPTSKISK